MILMLIFFNISSLNYQLSIINYQLQTPHFKLHTSSNHCLKLKNLKYFHLPIVYVDFFIIFAPAK